MTIPKPEWSGFQMVTVHKGPVFGGPLYLNLPKRKAFRKGRPLLQPGTVWNARSADLHDFEECFSNVRQGVKRQAFPIRGRHTIAPIGASEALTLSARGRAEGRGGC
jgi:hypothetical protein